MKNVINRAFMAKKKIFILALSAIFVANISAQEPKKEKCEGFNPEAKVECDIKRFTNELMLSDQQAEKFAVIYREYAAKLDEQFKQNAPAQCEKGKVLTDAELDKAAKARFEGFKALADLQSNYYDKFRKVLSARQAEKVLRFEEPFGHKQCCGKHEGKHEGKSFEKQAFDKQGKPDAPRKMDKAPRREK